MKVVTNLWNGSVQLMDGINDATGAKDSGFWRYVSGGFGALAAYKGCDAMIPVMGDTAKDIAKEFKQGDYLEAAGKGILLTSEVAVTGVVATLGAAAIATAVKPSLADKI